MFKRFLCSALSLAMAACLFVPTDSFAAWPEKPVKFLFGSGAGTSIDMVGRVIAQKLSEKFGQPFVPQNVSGGGLGAFTMTLKNAKADGYTIGLGADTYFFFDSLNPKAQFKMENFKYVCTLFQGDCSFFCNPDKKWKNIKEALEESKTGAPINYLFMTLMDRKVMEEYAKQVPGSKINFVPSQSPAASVTSIIGGHGDLAFSGGLHYEQDRAGKVRTITLTTTKRTSHFPNVPTTSELMNPAYPIDAYRLIVVPADFPQDALAALEKALEEIVTSEEFKKTVDDKLHFIPVYLNSEELTKELYRLRDESKQFWK